jgi:hypothetical protein
MDDVTSPLTRMISPYGEKQTRDTITLTLLPPQAAEISAISQKVE